MTATHTRITYPAALEPGQRPLLLFHRHLRAVRAAGDSPADYDILMFRPPAPETDEDVGGGGGDAYADLGGWVPVHAAKYLKHRSLEWREAERVEELPPEYQELAALLDAAFQTEPADAMSGATEGGAS